MKIKNLTLLLIILLPFSCIAGSQSSVQSRQLKSAISYEEDNQSKIEIQAKEIKQLLGRIELLEHNLAQLKERIEVIDLSPSLSSNNELPGNQTLATENNQGFAEDDIFNEPVNTKAPPVLVPAVDKNAKAPKVSSAISDSKDKKLYDTALAALKDNKLEIAEEKFANFIKEYPRSLLQSNAYFWYGETFFKRNMHDKAAINYLKGYKQYPKGAKAADSLLKLALSLGELKKKSEGCAMLTKLEAEFPNRPAASIKRARDAKVKFGCK